MTKAEETDSKFFALTVLISSLFVYNSLGAISGDHLTLLSNIIKMTEVINKNANKKYAQDEELKLNDGEDISTTKSFFPSLFWVVRDFSLSKLNSEGIQLTDEDYLAKALTEQDGKSENILRFNRVRRTLKEFFPNRLCKCLIQPFKEDDEDSSEPKTEKEKFTQQINELRKLIVTKLVPKTINDGDLVDGFVLVSMVKTYIESMNNGDIPDIISTWDSISEIHSRKQLNMILAKCETELKSRLCTDAIVNEIEVIAACGASNILATKTYLEK